MMYTIDQKTSNRITCLRAICIILVIILHQYAGDMRDATFVASGTMPDNPVLDAFQYIISREIAAVAVPLFFLISSMLLYAKEFTWKSNLKKKVKTIVLPYFIWISLYIFAYWIGQTLTLTKGFFANADRLVCDMRFVDFIGAYTGICGAGLFVTALWFLRDLILLNLFAPVIKRLIDQFPLLYLALLIICWNVGAIPQICILHKQSIVFFSLGYYVVKFCVHVERIDNILPLSGGTLIYLTTIAWEYYLHVQGNTLVSAAHSLTVVAGMLLFIRLSGLICRNENGKLFGSLQTIATYSFFIYVSHDFVQTVLKKLAAKILPQTDAVQMMEYFLIPVLVCIVCTAIAVLLKKVMRPVYNILTGSRN